MKKINKKYKNIKKFPLGRQQDWNKISAVAGLKFFFGKKSANIFFLYIRAPKFKALRFGLLNILFFTPIPCTYTSSPLDGMARNYIIIIVSTWIRKITQFIVSESILFLPPYTQGENKHLVWAGIEPRSSCFTSNPSDH